MGICMKIKGITSYSNTWKEEIDLQNKQYISHFPLLFFYSLDMLAKLQIVSQEFHYRYLC